MHLQHMNIRSGCNVTVVIVVMTNCTHLPNLFARVGVLAVEHIAVGLGTVWYASKCLGKLNPSNVFERVVRL